MFVLAHVSDPHLGPVPIPRFRVGMTPALCVLVGALPAAIGTLAARSRTALAAA